MFYKNIFFILLIAALTACAPVGSTPTAVATEAPFLESVQAVETYEPYHLVIAAYPYMTEAPYFIAQEEGYFAEQGLDVEFMRFEKTAEVLPALISGQLDVTSSLPTPGLINAIAGGARLRIVAGKGHVDSEGCSHVALMVAPEMLESGLLDDPANWVGLTFTTDKGTLVEYAIAQYLEQNGLSMDQLNYVEMPITSRLEALQNGSIDIAAAGEPWITRITNAGAGVVWVPLEQMIPDSQYGFVLFGPSLLDEHPDVGQRFMVALLKGIAQYNEGKTDRNIEIITEYTQLDPEELRQACWQSIRPDGDLNIQSILDYQDWAVEVGYVPAAITAEELWDASFVGYAHQFLP